MTPNPHTLTPLNDAERTLGVVVGFDGSEQSFLALHYAARAAQRRNSQLTVVNAYRLPAQFYSTLAALPPEGEADLPRQDSEAVLAQAHEYLQDYPGHVVAHSVEGDAAGVLVKLSASAQLVVLGGRGRGGFVGRIVGSVATAVPAHAHCPTVIVPASYDPQAGVGPDGGRFSPAQDPRPVVVGVDGSSISRVAALQAAEAAAERGAPLHAIIALLPLDDVTGWYPDIGFDSSYAEQRRRELEEHAQAEAAWLQSRVPGAQVSGVVEVGAADDVLAQRSAEAQLTVVGTRGRGGIRSALLGSTSRSVLTAAAGPVMIVPDLPEPRLEDQPQFPA
ncbi:universal stress protein [Nesterenkonia lacusekhoensis]|uniref:Nucleotide-binding universal stress UspA family protein n=1 Tax=Nesterenkonia lacusekhoensis TaxID=150832 RepID=A0ABS4SXW3_9MICC|nr:universal stress protein [Nesterenkonia lacusekhoensis]MBP2317041.1 nucleotide-binding universal stress UspA family protein [Nesterenkonia lacusekhoensis]